MSQAAVRSIEPGEDRSVLIVTAHADDVTLFLGGTVVRLSDAGWRIVVVRVTDDRWDSVGTTENDTLDANRVEFEAATTILGVHETVSFGYRTDSLGDTSEVGLREQVIRQIRTTQPYALVTFDPYAMYGEDNQDHLVVAAAVDEAFWTSQFDLHHPEHLAAGLETHGCFERWYFGRDLQRVTDVVDISDVLDRKVDAACAHRTMMLNFLNQLRLQARTGGWRLDAVDDALRGHDPRPVLEPLLRAGAARTGDRHGLEAAEEFRVVRFGGMHQMLERLGTRYADGPRTPPDESEQS